MKRNGFTITESLITLAIIGVIAMLTIPSFISEYNKSTYGPRLATEIANLESTLTTIITKENIEDLTKSKIYSLTGSAMGRELAHVLELKKNVNNSNEIYGNEKIRNISGEELSDPFYPSATNVLTKTGSFLCFFSHIAHDTLTEEEALEKNTAITKIVYQLIIDINGSQKPNTLGRDIFHFGIDKSGVLYPYGSKDYANYMGETNGFDVWSIGNHNLSCTDTSKGNGSGCTARLIDNGYKMDY